MTAEEKKVYSKQYREKNRDRIREQNNKYMKQYREKNKDKIREQQREYYQKHKERLSEYSRKWKEDNKEHVDSYNKKYREEHAKEHSEYIKNRRNQDATYKMICSVRNMLNNAFNKRTRVGKRLETEAILGCSIEQFIEHLKSQFQEGMTIKNHGEWHIDHIIPLSQAENEEDVIRLNHYTNLRPLWAVDNIRKSNKTS